MGKILCWIGFHKWTRKLHFTPESMLEWRGCGREGCEVGFWQTTTCTYYGPDMEEYSRPKDKK